MGITERQKNARMKTLVLVEAARLGRTRPPDGFKRVRRPRSTLWFDHHGQSHPDEGEQGDRIPVGEAEAAVRLGAADFFGIGGAMQAVAGAVEPDPGEAHGIVRPGRDDELSLPADPR